MKKLQDTAAPPPSVTRLVSRKALIHGIAECRQCGWMCDNYLNVQRLAAQHAKKTGHHVTAELGYVVEYG